MDKELYEKTLAELSGDENYSKFHETFKSLQFDQSMVYGKYLWLQPPIPGITLSDYDYAKNIFSMKYNELFNTKHNIDPLAHLYEDHSYTDSDDDTR